MGTHDITLNTVLVDWLTLTTWSVSLWYDVLNEWTDVTNQRELTIEPVLLMGYSGFSYNGVWFVQREHHEGEHAGHIHMMIRVSGSRSHEFTQFLREKKKSLNIAGFKCTRLDLQITIEGNLTPARGIVNLLRAYDGWGRGIPPKITLIEGDNNTVYIGSRTSERYVRFYEKENDYDKLVRFEIEYKGSQAEQLFPVVLHNPKNGKRALHGFYEKLPEGLSRFYPAFYAFRLWFIHSDSLPIRTIPKDSNTIHWLKNQVDSAIRKLAGDHTNRNTLLPLFQSWVILYEQGEGFEP
jgi:hypothetical protein